jgi:hypothetical protein
MAGYGLSFQPGADNGKDPRTRPQVQDAVKLLSLRLPTVVGARALAPQGLLQSQGGAALGGGKSNAILEWLKRLLQGSGGQPPPQLSAAGGYLGQSGETMGSGRVFAPQIVPGSAPGGDSWSAIESGESRSSAQPVWKEPYPEPGKIGNPWDYPAPTGGGDLPPLAPGVHRADEDPFDIWT